MPMSYQDLGLREWIVLGLIAALCLFIAWVLAFRPMIPWRSTQRWRAPEQTEEELGEPTAGFCRGCRVIAAAVVLAGLICALSPLVAPLIHP